MPRASRQNTVTRIPRMSSIRIRRQYFTPQRCPVYCPGQRITTGRFPEVHLRSARNINSSPVKGGNKQQLERLRPKKSPPSKKKNLFKKKGWQKSRERRNRKRRHRLGFKKRV